jgi:hypothetical protein
MKPTQIETDVALLQSSSLTEFRQIFIALKALQDNIATLAKESSTLLSNITSLVSKGVVVKRFALNADLDMQAPSEPIDTIFLYVFVHDNTTDTFTVTWPDPPFQHMGQPFQGENLITLMWAYKAASALVLPAQGKFGGFNVS